MAADGKFVKSLPSPSNLPNEPVDIEEPLTPPPTNLIPLPLNSPVKEPLISVANCEEPLTIPASKAAIAVFDNEPLISSAI